MAYSQGEKKKWIELIPEEASKLELFIKDIKSAVFHVFNE